MTPDLLKESRRLRSIADEAKARLDALEARADSAAESCFPGPAPAAESARTFDRTDEMARHLMQTANRLHHAGKLNKATLADELTNSLRRRWPDVEIREIEAAALKFMALADELEKLKPANDRGRRH